MTKKVALYIRCSTTEQDTSNQRLQLEEAARRHGWNVIAVYEDAGISGARGRDRRPGYDALCRAIARREVDLIAAWDVSRLSRSLRDLVALLEELRSKEVDLFLLQSGLDTSTPAGRALFQMLGIFSELERELIRERVRAGLQRARAAGIKLGNPGLPAATKERIVALRLTGATIPAIAKQLGIAVSSCEKVLRLHRRSQQEVAS